MLKVGTKAWQAVTRKRVGKAMDILTRGGRRVYWVGNPIMRNSVYRDKIAMINKIYAAEAKKHPGVQFISTWMLFAGEKGGYAEALKDASGDLVIMRAPDGVHLTRAGGDRMAQVVLDVIEKDWGIPQHGAAEPALGRRPPAPLQPRRRPSSTQSRVRNSQKARPAKVP